MSSYSQHSDMGFPGTVIAGPSDAYIPSAGPEKSTLARDARPARPTVRGRQTDLTDFRDNPPVLSHVVIVLPHLWHSRVRTIRPFQYGRVQATRNRSWLQCLHSSPLVGSSAGNHIGHCGFDMGGGGGDNRVSVNVTLSVAVTRRM